MLRWIKQKFNIFYYKNFGKRYSHEEVVAIRIRNRNAL